MKFSGGGSWATSRRLEKMFLRSTSVCTFRLLSIFPEMSLPHIQEPLGQGWIEDWKETGYGYPPSHGQGHLGTDATLLTWSMAWALPRWSLASNQKFSPHEARSVLTIWGLGGHQREDRTGTQREVLRGASRLVRSGTIKGPFFQLPQTLSSSKRLVPCPIGTYIHWARTDGEETAPVLFRSSRMSNAGGPPDLLILYIETLLLLFSVTHFQREDEGCGRETI